MIKKAELKFGDWLLILGAALSALAIIAGLAFFFLIENPNRIRMEEEVEQIKASGG